MQQNLINEQSDSVLNNINYIVGNADIINQMISVKTREPFDDRVIQFLNALSKRLINSRDAKIFSDVITFGFWIRKASIEMIKNRFLKDDRNIHMGRGIAFHIAPSNVPVNYAYSLVVGLLTGNVNIVRIPSKDYPQIAIINEAIKDVLTTYTDMREYICLIRYGREREINDFLSEIADIRIVWGGDETITELRKSPIKPRTCEITFADRYSMAVIDSDEYMSIADKNKVAEDFYNDTYLTDQNACTSPRLIVWMGSKKEQAKQLFWELLHTLVSKKYTYQPIQGINKLTSSCMMAAILDGVKIEEHIDNLLVRVKLPILSSKVMQLKDNSGYFFEYDCEDIVDLIDICNDTRCQTIGYIGENTIFLELLKSGVKGVDRVVPIGKSMDFDFIWDGYNLYERMTRTINLI